MSKNEKPMVIDMAGKISVIKSKSITAKCERCHIALLIPFFDYNASNLYICSVCDKEAKENNEI